MDQDLENSMNNCESISGIIKTDLKSLQNGVVDLNYFLL